MKLLPILFLFLSTAAVAQTVDYDSKLKSLGIELFTQTKPKANYVRAVRSGKLIFLCGHGSTKADGTVVYGRVGEPLTLEQGIEAARLSTISLLSTLKEEIGDFNKVKRIVKVTGFVHCNSSFADHSKVMNGCSDLLVAIFGDKGFHARTSVGVNSLPNNFVTEIEMIVEID